MEVPITQFRRKLFDLVDQALDGKEVWVSHKGRRLRLVPEHAPSKLSRVTQLDVIAPGVDIDDDSWKAEIFRKWVQKWDRRLGPVQKPVRSASTKVGVEARRARRKA
jgi:antitoxin (DNA-binding transcriptional repressor) of toxin-antitoxin stability system